MVQAEEKLGDIINRETDERMATENKERLIEECKERKQNIQDLKTELAIMTRSIERQEEKLEEWLKNL